MDAKHGVYQHRSIPKPCRQPEHPQRSQLADSARQDAASSACPEEISTMALLLFASTPNVSRERRHSVSRVMRYGRQGRKGKCLAQGLKE